MMHIAFAIHERNKSIIPTIVSLFTWSKAYHCQLVFSDGVAITTDISKDVHFTETTYDKWHWVLLPLPWITEEQENDIRITSSVLVENRADYDLIGAIFGRLSKWFNNSGDYFCTELCAELLSTYTPELFKDTWYNPDDIWKIINDKLMKEYPDYAKVWLYTFSKDAQKTNTDDDSSSDSVEESDKISDVSEISAFAKYSTPTYNLCGIVYNKK